MSSLQIMTEFDYQQLPAEVLLQPIKGEIRVGTCQRYDAVYDQVREAIRADANTLPKELLDHDAKQANWQSATQICLHTLEHLSKDLQIAGWLALAELHTHGFSGFKEGIQLLIELSEHYWDDIHPTSPDDPEIRLAPFVWMETKIPMYLYRINLTPYQNSIEQRHTEINNLASLIRMKNDNENEADDAHSLYLKAALHAPTGFHQTMDENIQELLTLFDKLKTLIHQKHGPEAPVFSEIFQLLEHIRLINQQALTTHTEDEVEQASTHQETKTIQHDENLTVELDEVFAKLDEISSFLIHTAPGCPTGYLVQQAVNYRSTDVREIIDSLPFGTSLRDQLLTIGHEPERDATHQPYQPLIGGNTNE